jgi:phospholipid transport system substrate-binding protein
VTKRLTTALMLLCLLLPLATVAAPQPQAAAELIRQTFQESAQAVQEHRSAIERNPQMAYRLIDRILAPHVNFELMAQLVLGRHWQQAPPEQRRRFVALFRESLLRGYSVVLSSNVDSVVRRLESGSVLLEVLSVRADGDDRATVQTALRLGDQSIPIDYRLHAGGGEWQVYDVLIGGISFVINYRVEYRALLRHQSLEALMQDIERHGAQVWQPAVD